MTAPTVNAYITPDGTQWGVPCCACRRWHLHGPGEGHAGSHCFNPDSPYQSGYYLRLAGKMPYSAWHKYWTRTAFPKGLCA